MLYVPVTQLDLVTKYVGGKDEQTVKLNRLGGNEWNRTRQRVKKIGGGYGGGAHPAVCQAQHCKGLCL